jgi:hypothetical protein
MNRQFCLDKPEEKVQEIVLIISNSNLNSEEFNPFDYDVDTTGECPFEISGTTKITYTIDEQSSEAGATGGTTMSGTFTSADVLWYDKEEEAYKIKSRTISCVYNEHTNAQDALYGFDSTRSGSGTTTEEYDEISEAPLKIRFDENDNNIDFFVYPDYQNPDWVSYTSTVTTTISGAGSTTQTFSEMDSCTFVSAMDYLTELEMSEFDGHRISGTRTFSHGGTSSIVEYDYTLSR